MIGAGVRGSFYIRLDLMGFGKLVKKESSAFVLSKLAYGGIIFWIMKNRGY